MCGGDDVWAMRQHASTANSGIGALLADSYTAAFARKRLERRAMEERAPGIAAP